MFLAQLERAPFHTTPYRTSGPGGRVREAELPWMRGRLDGWPGQGCLVLTSDLQGRVDTALLGEVVAQELAILSEMEAIPPVGGVVLAGDLYDHPTLAKLGASGDVEPVWTAAAAIAPVAGVLGNHDVLDAVPPSAVLLDGQVVEWQGIRVGGVGGIIGDDRRPLRRSPSAFCAALQGVLRRRPDLVVLHQGPDDPGTGQRGSPEVRAVLESAPTMLLVSGHCHWTDPIATIGRTQVVNVDARVLVLTGAKSP